MRKPLLINKTLECFGQRSFHCTIRCIYYCCMSITYICDGFRQASYTETIS